jgi:branched-chain amino acid transport system substrate-binding protein
VSHRTLGPLARLGVVAVGAATLLVTGCGGGSGGSTGSGGSSVKQSTAPAPTGSPINIGVIGSFTGPQASSSSQGSTVGPAWERYINEQLGGINGHPVKVFVEDDGGDPAKAQAAEKKLVDTDKVLAIVASSDNELSAFDTDAVSKGVPVVSGAASATDWYTKPGLYVTVTDVLSGLTGQVLIAKSFGKATKFADLYCSEVAACGQANAPLQAAAQKAGLGFTSLAVSSTATSYTAECLKLQQQKVDYAQLNFTTTAAAKFVQDCQQQGYNPTWGTTAQAVGPDLLGISDFTAYGPAFAFPSVGGTPAVTTFVNAMKRFAKNDNWAEGTGSFTWTGLEAIHQALATAGPTVTAATVGNGLNSFKNESLNGLLANPLTFSAGKAVSFGAHPCSFVIGIKDGKTVAPDGLKTVCANNS